MKWRLTMHCLLLMGACQLTAMDWHDAAWAYQQDKQVVIKAFDYILTAPDNLTYFDRSTSNSDREFLRESLAGDGANQSEVAKKIRAAANNLGIEFMKETPGDEQRQDFGFPSASVRSLRWRHTKLL